MATDYHKTIRDAVAETLDGLGLGITVETVDDIDDATKVELPVIAVCCVGPDQDRGDWSTNASDGIGYSVAVMLLQVGSTSAETTPGVPDLTSFRRSVRVAFNNKRLSGVTQVGYCEVGDAGPLVDEKSPLFQKLATALIVTAVGRFPRS